MTYFGSRHKLSHQDGGGDEIDCTGLNGRVNYIDRGDPTGFDWTSSDFIKDNNWHDLDCSAIVPEGAKAIHLRITISATATDKIGTLREKGNSNTRNALLAWTATANISSEQDGLVVCDANRKLEYRFSVATWGWISIVIRGWLI